MINYEKEICSYYGLPSIPKREWDGKSEFDKGVAVVELRDERLAYAACRYNTGKGDLQPRIVKVFSIDTICDVKDIYVVPAYMSDVNDVQDMDLDEESKKHAEQLLNEATELENEEVESNSVDMPENEWVFDEIHNKSEAVAWLKQYNKRNGIRKGRIPQNEETLKLRLFSIYSEMCKKNK